MNIDKDINSMYPGYKSTWDILVGGHNFNPTYWPHVKMLAWNQVFDAERWCYKNFKSRDWRSRGQFFAFKKDRDFTAFALRWS